MSRARVKKNDIVVVVSGKDRGKRGRVLQVLPAKSRVMVEGVNVVKRHTKPMPQRNIKGGIVEKEAPIHISNVMVIDPSTDKPTRVGRTLLANGQLARVARRSGEVLDK
jgi:large subunit ribosomal protein L24